MNVRNGFLPSRFDLFRETRTETDPQITPCNESRFAETRTETSVHSVSAFRPLPSLGRAERNEDRNESRNIAFGGAPRECPQDKQTHSHGVLPPLVRPGPPGAFPAVGQPARVALPIARMSSPNTRSSRRKSARKIDRLPTAGSLSCPMAVGLALNTKSGAIVLPRATSAST